jgi:hypothetical protein
VGTKTVVLIKKYLRKKPASERVVLVSTCPNFVESKSWGDWKHFNKSPMCAIAVFNLIVEWCAIVWITINAIGRRKLRRKERRRTKKKWGEE